MKGTSFISIFISGATLSCFSQISGNPLGNGLTGKLIRAEGEVDYPVVDRIFCTLMGQQGTRKLDEMDSLEPEV